MWFGTSELLEPPQAHRGEHLALVRDRRAPGSSRTRSSGRSRPSAGRRTRARTGPGPCRSADASRQGSQTACGGVVTPGIVPSRRFAVRSTPASFAADAEHAVPHVAEQPVVELADAADRPGPLDQLGRRGSPLGVVRGQRRADRCAQVPGERAGVLDRRAGAAAQVRRHRVGGITEQDDAALHERDQRQRAGRRCRSAARSCVRREQLRDRLVPARRTAPDTSAWSPLWPPGGWRSRTSSTGRRSAARTRTAALGPTSRRRRRPAPPRRSPGTPYSPEYRGPPYCRVEHPADRHSAARRQQPPAPRGTPSPACTVTPSRPA